MTHEKARIAFSLPDIDDSDIAAVEAVLRSGWITTGQECLQLEAELREYLRVPHVLAMSSCTAALETACAFLRLPSGARVGVPTWTFASSALAPMKAGYLPVLLDVDSDSLNLSADSVSRGLQGGLDALVVVHFGGVPVDRDVFDLCREAGVPVIEDAAHAFGSTSGGKKLNGMNSIGAAFSFYATKNLTSGEGGALATNDDALAEFAGAYRLHGLSRDAWRRYEPQAEATYDVLVPGIKGNLPDILAGLARSQLRRFEPMQARRRHLVRRYREELAGIPGLRLVPSIPCEDSADHLLVVVLPEDVRRGEVVRCLSSEGIGSSVHFQPLHTFDWFRSNAEIGPGGAPVADSLRHRVMSLPLHSRLTDDDVLRVAAALWRAVS